MGVMGGRRNNWHTVVGPVAHAHLLNKISILLESYGPYVTVYHVTFHAGLTENE